MNIEDTMKGLLIEHGMFDNQAAEVIETAKKDDVCASISGRWNDDMGGYPPMMANVIWLNVKAVSLKWIEENAPDAWFKPMFTEAG